MRLRKLGSLVAVAGLVVASAVLALGTTQAQAPTVEETVAGAVEAWNAEDAAAFIGYWTPAGLEAEFGITPADDAEEAIMGEMAEAGPIASSSVTDIRVAGGGITANVELVFEFGFSLFEKWEFLNSGDGWQVNGSEPASRPIPPGVPAVDLGLQEYAFVFNEAALNAADGNFAFNVTNTGQEEHEVVILGIEGDASILEILQNADPESEDLPEGIGFFTFGGFFEPGQSGTVVLDQPLSPGKYALVCFLPSPEGIPHAVLGMVSPFTIGSGPVDGGGGGNGGGGGGPITPPSTGDGGIASGPTGIAVFGALLALGFAGSFAAMRARKA